MAEASSIRRSEIVAEARSWLGTPYRHQASVKDAGCDCLGLVRGVWRAFHGDEPVKLPAYSRDWGDVEGKETLLETANTYLVRIEPVSLLAGNIVVFRLKRGRVAKHCGILTGPGAFIHAQDRVAVTEVPLGEYWSRRVVATYGFPGVID